MDEKVSTTEEQKMSTETSSPQTVDAPEAHPLTQPNTAASSASVEEEVEVFTGIPDHLPTVDNPPFNPFPKPKKHMDDELAAAKERGKAAIEKRKEEEQEDELAKMFMKSAPIDEQVVEAISEIYDPEIPVNIYELGLIYKITVEERDEGPHVDVEMTLTSPACPVAGTLPGEVEQKVLQIPAVKTVRVELTWDPPWGPDMMSEAAQLQLGFF